MDWQKKWESDKIYQVSNSSDKKNYYVLDMYPYPSGVGLHVGHLEGYTATDIYSRYMRMLGFSVLHPMGWDAFGLPAENFAIKQGVHPQETTKKAVNRFKEQFDLCGMSFDWSREINSSDPSYYKWTQWFFLLLYENNLAYRKEAPVNWCPSCQTVLANEQVINKEGKDVCERCDTEVIQKNLEQWFFKITDYADRLLKDLDKVDWLESTKTAQKNWIGKQEGFEVFWEVSGSQTTLATFTKFPETLFGATFISIAPENPLVKELTVPERTDEVTKYVEEAKSKSRIERTNAESEKTGVFTGSYAVNPVNQELIPIWVSDYVISDYGTGAVFGCPAHDERDFAFAKKYELPIKRVIKGFEGDEGDIKTSKDVIEDGIMVNSGILDGLSAQTEAKAKIKETLSESGKGREVVLFRIRDWLISRQRYWGAPIPIIYCQNCLGNPERKSANINGIKYAIIPVPKKDLPVLLPYDVDFKPTGESPLASSQEFHKVTCPDCKATEGVRRESDTLDTFVDSSWYFFRFCDPNNDKEFASKEAVKAWCPVDFYVGADHATTHLIFSRFFTKVLYDLKYIDFDEPFLKMRIVGHILGEDSRKMSKRWGNVVNPEDVVSAFGADTLRTYEMFMGPLEATKAWNTSGVEGVRRFYNRVWDLATETIKEGRKDSSGEGRRMIHKLIKKVTEDIEELKFNTAVAFMMEYVNFWSKNKQVVGVDSLNLFVRILAPFAPFMAEDLWQLMSQQGSVHLSQWPSYDPKLVEESEATVVVQINGKVKERLKVPARKTDDAEWIKSEALNAVKVRELIGNKEIKNIHYVQGKLINIVI